LAAARSIADRGTASPELLRQASDLINIGEKAVADELRRQRQDVDDVFPAGSPGPTSREISHGSAVEHQLGVYPDGSDLVVTVGGHDLTDEAVDVVADGNFVVLTRNNEPGWVVQSIDLHRPIATEDLSTSFSDDGVTVRVHEFMNADHAYGGSAAVEVSAMQRDLRR
jgi:hypothetical protein